MQAAGRSKISIVMAALKTAIPLMLLVGMMGEYVAPAAKRMADDIKAGAMSEGRLTVSAYGVWARDGKLRQHQQGAQRWRPDRHHPLPLPVPQP